MDAYAAGQKWLGGILLKQDEERAARGAVKQIQENPGGVILELVGDVVMADLERVLSGRFKRVGIDEMDILIMSQNALKKVLRYKK